MNIKVNLKQLGKRRDKISGEDFNIENKPTNVRELICEVVHTCVYCYNNRVEQKDNAAVIEADKIEKMGELGKIAFGINYGGRKADEEEAVQTALQAFEDGLFRVFLGDKELTELSENITITEDDSLTFIRLTMLSGRMYI
ncbi:MAG: hypothetical protein HDT39_16175 [Lachnospiraceae bacterium]|nr:hypothetical protein [Lachnospiraceae bacterium]